MGKEQSKVSGNPVEGVSLKPREGEFVQQPIGNTSRSLSTGGTSGENMPGEHVEAEVCGVGDLKDGEMKEVEVGEGKALLVKDGGQFYAVGAKCTHYGAPLVKGVLCNGRVRCPWHGACFNVKTGDIEEFPGFDSLPKFEVSISSGKVKVKADKASLSKTRRWLEVATYMVRKACSVDVIARGAVPLENVFGMQIGNLIKKMHEDKGVKFHFESGLKEFVGTAGSVSEVVLSDGTKLPADVVILGVGVAPATDFLKSCDIKMNRGFVTVDEFMQTSLPDIYAAGDIVEFPLFTVGDSPVNVQHWQMAHAHGRNAAYNILGRKQKIRSVPYFWTVMYGKSIRYTGYGPGYDDIVIHGDVDALKFVAFYTKGDNVVAVASLNYDPIVSQAAEYMMSEKTITKTEITEDPQCWVSRL